MKVRLYYFGARWYDPELGLWISPDPAHQFNSPYAYGYAPAIMVDENGLWFGLDDAVAFVVGAAVGAGVAIYNGYDPTDAEFWGYTAGGGALGWAGYNSGGAAIAAYQAGGTAATAVVVGTSVGAGVGAGYGGVKAYNQGYDLSDWQTYAYVGGGAAIGGVTGFASAGFGSSIAGLYTGSNLIVAGGIYGASAGAMSGGLNAWAFGGGNQSGFFQGSGTDIAWGIGGGAVIGGALGAASGWAQQNVDAATKSSMSKIRDGIDAATDAGQDGLKAEFPVVDAAGKVIENGTLKGGSGLIEKAFPQVFEALNYGLSSFYESGALGSIGPALSYPGADLVRHQFPTSVPEFKTPKVKMPTDFLSKNTNSSRTIGWY